MKTFKYYCHLLVIINVTWSLYCLSKYHIIHVYGCGVCLFRKMSPYVLIFVYFQNFLNKVSFIVWFLFGFWFWFLIITILTLKSFVFLLLTHIVTVCQHPGLLFLDKRAYVRNSKRQIQHMPLKNLLRIINHPISVLFLIQKTFPWFAFRFYFWNLNCSVCDTIFFNSCVKF